MGRGESPELGLIDDTLAAIDLAAKRLAWLTRSLAPLAPERALRLREAIEALARIKGYQLALRDVHSAAYQKAPR